MASHSCGKNVLFIDDVDNASLNNGIDHSLFATKNTFLMNQDLLSLMTCWVLPIFLYPK